MLLADETDGKRRGKTRLTPLSHSCFWFLLSPFSKKTKQVKQAIHVAAQPADGCAQDPDSEAGRREQQQQEDMDRKRAAGEADEGGMTDEQLRAVFRATSSARVARAVAGAADPWGFFDDDGFGAAYSASASGYFDSEDGEDEDEDEDALAGFWGDGAGGAGGDDDGDDGGEPRRGGAAAGRKGSGGRGGGAAAKKRPPSRLGGGVGGGGGGGQTNASRAAIPRTHHVLTTAGGGGGGQQALIRRKVRGGGGLGASSSSSHELFTLRLPPPPMPLSWGRTVRQWEPSTARIPRGCASTEEAVSEAAKEVQPFAADAPLVIAGAAVMPPHAGHLLASSDVPALAKKIVKSSIEANGAGGSYKRVFQAVVVHPGWVSSSSDSGNEEGGTKAPSSSSSAAAAANAAAVHPAAAEASLRSFASLDLHRLVPSGYAFVWCPKAAILTLTKQMYAWGFAYVENLTWVQLAPCTAIAADATPPATPPRDSSSPSSNDTTSSSPYPPPLVARSHETLMIYRRGAEDVELRHQRSPDVVFDAADAGGGGARAGGASGCRVGFGMPAAVYATIETMLPRARGAMLELWCGGRAGKRAGWTRVVQCCE
jgi:hypothetical protein